MSSNIKCHFKKFPLGNTFLHYFTLKNCEINKDEIFSYLQSFDFCSGDFLGRKVTRTQRWYHDSSEYFNNKWPVFNRWKAVENDNFLTNLKNKVISIAKSKVSIPDTVNFNSFLINKYHNGSSIIPKHRDSEEIFGDNPWIVILSLGCKRTLRFTRVKPNTRSLKKIADTIPIDFILESGSVLIMSGTAQKYYCHEILPEKESDIRYSITYRHHHVIAR